MTYETCTGTTHSDFDSLMSLVAKLRAAFRIPPKERALISFVLHFRQPMPLTDGRIQLAVERAWGRAVSEERNEHITNKPPLCFVKFENFVLLLRSGARNYCPAEYLEEALAQFPEETQKAVACDHKAFLTIDLMNPKHPTRSEKKACYRRMGSLAAELVDENCMGVYVPETGRMYPYHVELTAALRSNDPVRAL